MNLQEQNIDLNDLLNMIGNKQDYEKEVELFIESQSNYCASMGYLVSNIQDLNDRQLNLTMKTVKKLLDESVNRSYDLIKKIGLKHQDVSFCKFINDEY